MPDLVTTIGKQQIANRLNGTGTIFGWLGIGTGTTAPAAGDTALQTALGARLAATNSVVTTTTTNDTFRAVATFPGATYAGTITECGLFDALTAGNMIERSTFSAIGVSALDSIQIVMDLKFS